MPQRHAAYPEESSRLSTCCQEIDREIDRLSRQETDSWDIHAISAEQLHNLQAVAQSPYYTRLLLRYDDGTEKDVCLAETLRDILLKDTYIAGIGSPLRQLIHKNSRDQHLVTASGNVRQVHLRLRRQIGIEQRAIHSLSDTLPLATGSEGQATAGDIDVFAQLGQDYLLQQLGREASTQARSILATISERQDELMSAPADRLLVVNGAPGSGKTAIAHSRIPLLLHEDRRGKTRLEEKRIAVFVPNHFMQSYLRALLPRYGLRDIYQTTFEDWAMRMVNRPGGRQIGRVTEETARVIFDKKASRQEKKAAWRRASLRGDRRMALVLRHLLAEGIAEQVRGWQLDVRAERSGARGAPPLEFQVSLAHLRPLVEEFREGTVRLPALRTTLQSAAMRAAEAELRAQQQEAAEQELARIEAAELPPEQQRRAREAVQTWTFRQADLPDLIARDIEQFTPWANAWEAYLALVGQRGRVEAAARRVFGAEARGCAEALYRKPRERQAADTRPPEPTDITELPLVLALKLLLEGPQAADRELQGRSDSAGRFDYLVIDEGQDLSPLQYDLLSTFVRPGHAAVFGDLRQSIHGYRGIRDWQVVIDALGTGQEQVEQLHLTFRSSQEITEQANRVLEAIGSAQPRAQAVPRPGPPVHFVRYGREADLVPLLAHEVRRLQREGARNIGIITRSPEESQGLYERVKDRKAFPIDSRTRNFENYSGGTAVVPIGVAKGLEFDAAILIRADAATYSPGTPYDGPLLYTAVSRALHHLTIFAAEAFTPLLGEVPGAQPGLCLVSGLEISPAGFHRPPPHLTGRARKAGQERGPGANQQEMVRTYDGRFDSTPSYEGDGSRENPWHDR